MAAATTVPRSHALLSHNGYHSDTVERWLHRHRKDYLGFADIIAFGPFPEPFDGCLAIQTTSYSNLSAHLSPLRIENRDTDLYQTVVRWLLAGNRLEYWGWSPRKSPATGRTTMIPAYRRIELTPAYDLEILAHITELTRWPWIKPLNATATTPSPPRKPPRKLKNPG